MPITVKHLKVSTVPDAGDDTLVKPSDWNADHTLTGLGTMAEQNANAVAITGGTISGVTLPASNITGTLGVPNGGTGASTLTGYVKGTGTTAMTAAATIPNTDITGLGTASTKDAGAALGVATLDAGGKVPVSELPAAVLGALSYQGTWDASTNTPTLTSSVGTKGYYYVVSVAGNTNLNGITDWLIGDWAVYNGSVWQKVDNTETVTSVNGQTGAVVLTTTNIAEGTNEYFTTARARTSISAGTGISYDNTTGVVTNSAPDQIVSLTGAGTTSISGTYPNFTVTSNDQFTGTVTAVTGTAPVVSSGGNTPAISMAQATGSVDGYLSATDWTTFNSKGTVSSVTATSPVTSTGGTTPVIAMPAATSSVNGYLTSTDWTTFNNKSNTNGTVTSVAELTLGTTGTDLSSTVANGTTTPVITLQVPTASATNRGALSSADWTTFNNKAPAVTYTTNYIPFGQGTTTPNQSANLTFDGTTQSAPVQRASNGIITNNKTISASYTIPATDNAMSAGPVTIASGQTVTVSSGSRWVVL